MATSAITHQLPAATNSAHTLRIFRKETKYEFLKLMRTRSFSLSKRASTHRLHLLDAWSKLANLPSQGAERLTRYTSG